MGSSHAQDLGPRYVPRHTQDCDAVAIVREHLPRFVARLEDEGLSLPAFVRRELEAFTTCGDFGYGFLHVQCRRCGDSLRVPFSCKGRGFCPSCTGRRMAEAAALAVDHRLPAVPWRQWVLTFEGPMAVRLGYDAELLAFVCQRFATRLMQRLRHRVKHHYRRTTSRDLHAGVLIVVQRFKNDLGLFTHLHALVTDGCFEHRSDHDAPFLPVAALVHDDLTAVLDRVHLDLQRRDLDTAVDVDPALQACLALGRKRSMALTPHDDAAVRPLLAGAHGMQLHAAVTVDGRDRPRLERVVRYLYRPAFSHDAVKTMPDGSVRVMFKRPTKSGASFASMSPESFIARLAALVPPPRFHLSRSYGVLSPRHRLHRIVAPHDHRHDAPPSQLGLFVVQGTAASSATRGPLFDQQLEPPTPSRIAWSKLLARVFSIDVTVCRKCKGPMRIVEAVTDPDDISARLHGARAPPKPRPPLPGQLVLFSG